MALRGANMKKRERIRIKFNGLCAYTGKPLGDDWQVDHVTSKVKHIRRVWHTHNNVENALLDIRKVDSIDNLFPALRIVNHYKRGKDLEGFRRYMADFHKRLSRLPKNTNIERTKKRKEYMYKVAEAFGITPETPFSGKFYFETLKQRDYERD